MFSSMKLLTLLESTPNFESAFFLCWRLERAIAKTTCPESGKERYNGVMLGKGVVSMPNQLMFKNNDKELKHLSKSDSKMEHLINLIGTYNLNLRTDLFQSLIRTIVGQQLSIKAARTIWGRLQTELEEVSLEQILALPDESLRSLGLSRQKTKYIINLSEIMVKRGINLESLHKLSDQDVMEELLKIKGIGKWSAEMFMIFSLGRLDVLSVDDVGLKRAIQWLYELPEQPGTEEMLQIGEAWKPYRSVASLYLWEVINRDLMTKFTASNSAGTFLSFSNVNYPG